MNIKEVDEMIEGVIEAYLAKDAYGMYRIPFKMQRPIIMLGPPGVGKTAVVEQIAERMDINFVNYSITHHTRQSALGLPFITQEKFDGCEFNVSKYTMSEIIAAVYQARRDSGISEGILFLDEINCVSETLAPAMLQFLQHKTFGTHRLPEGWIIVTAGNPPEYNRAAREFDPAMLDRLLKIEVEPDIQAWQEYAASSGIHPAVTTYLEARPANFYKVRAAARDSKIVTGRGWEDLSCILQTLESLGREPREGLFELYLQDEVVARDFGAYYGLFRKYEEVYKIAAILCGQYNPDLIEKASAAPFDERIALVGLLLDAVVERVHDAVDFEEALGLVKKDLLDMKPKLGASGDTSIVVTKHKTTLQSASYANKRSKKLIGNSAAILAKRLRVLEEIESAIASEAIKGKGGFPTAKAVFDSECDRCSQIIDNARNTIGNVFDFLDQAFCEESQELLIFVTKLSVDPALAHLVACHGSEQYMRHSKCLLFTERNLRLLEEIESLEC